MGVSRQIYLGMDSGFLNLVWRLRKNQYLVKSRPQLCNFLWLFNQLLTLRIQLHLEFGYMPFLLSHLSAQGFELIVLLHEQLVLAGDILILPYELLRLLIEKLFKFLELWGIVRPVELLDNFRWLVVVLLNVGIEFICGLAESLDLVALLLDDYFAFAWLWQLLFKELRLVNGDAKEVDSFLVFNLVDRAHQLLKLFSSVFLI